MEHYLVIYERAEDGGWGAHSPTSTACLRSERRLTAHTPSGAAVGAREQQHRFSVGADQ